MAQDLAPQRLIAAPFLPTGLRKSSAPFRRDTSAYASQSTEPSRLVALVASARRSLDKDAGLARHYLDEISALLGDPDRDSHLAMALLPRRPLPRAGAAQGGLATWQVRRVTEFIDENLNGSLSSDQMAAVARVSTGHFCRAFKASIGETPHNYIIRQRVRRAQMLMLETGDSLAKVASACGLTDQAQLTRLFRRMLNTTPMAWRRTWQNAG